MALVPEPAASIETRLPLRSFTASILESAITTIWTVSGNSAAIARRLAALPSALKTPVPAKASAAMSAWARPEVTRPSLTARTLAIEPSEARAAAMRPIGPQRPSDSQRATPGGWLISEASIWPIG